MSVREYAASDLEACRDLWRDLTQRHRDIYDDPSIGGHDPGVEFDQHLSHQHLWKVWVAEHEAEIVGFSGLLVEGEEAVLEPIVVRPSHRGQGVGAGLAQHAIDEARRLGKQYINVRPVGRNIEAISFFHREGFRVLGRLELSLRLHADVFPGPERRVNVHGLPFIF